MLSRNRFFSLLGTAAMSLALVACTEADIDSPGEVGQIDDGGDNGGDNGGGGNGGGLTGECPEGSTEITQIDGNTACEISGAITEDLTLNNDVIHVLSGEVQIGVDVGSEGEGATIAGIGTSAVNPDGAPVVLTIEPGTIIVGAEASDSLIINRGSRIIAEGTANDPIIFTAKADIDGTVSEGDRGLWGGIVIAGQAPINNCDTAVTGGSADCQAQVEGSTVFYGGNDPADNSGSLRYVQVKYAGFEVFTDNELNGITFAGVGSGTEVDHIQVHNNLDDGVEFFGGTVSVSHLVLTGMGDDNIDWDAGWQGNLQHVIIVQASDDGDHLIEADNNGDTHTLTPVSNPTLSNFTFVGDPAAGNGILLRVGTNGTLVNGIVTGSTACLDIDDTATFSQDPTFNSVMLDCGTIFVDDSGDGGETAADVEAVFNDDPNNTTTTANTLTSTFINGAAESGITAFDPTGLSDFFDAVDYIGAVKDADDDWWRTWTCGLEAGSDC